MRFHILTLFPEMIIQGLNPGIIGKAVEKKLISLNAVNIRDYTRERHGKVDDYPYGGGAGMLIQAQPVWDAYRAVTGGRPVRTVYVTPQGFPFTQKMAGELAAEEELVFLCGHYEGIDERVLEEIVTDYVSIGDYVLTGGELPAMVMIDAITRLIPGVLGNDTSAEEESFHNDLLEYPQYSRPEVWQGKSVPKVLLSGNHSKVAEWRLEQSMERTARRRPDLYKKYQEKQRLIKLLSGDKRNNIHMMEGLAAGRSEILYVKGQDVLLYDSETQICKISAGDAVSGERLAGMVPEQAKAVVTSQEFMNGILTEKKYETICHCSQWLYTQKVVLPVRYKDIRRLSMDSFEYVCSFLCDGVSRHWGRACIRDIIQAGGMYGAFMEGRPVGFIGVHREGSLGMLFVEEAYRRQGFAQALEAYAVNIMLERGRTPYAYVPVDDVPTEKLQEKLGFYRAEKNFWWYLSGL